MLFLGYFVIEYLALLISPRFLNQQQQQQQDILHHQHFCNTQSAEERQLNKK